MVAYKDVDLVMTGPGAGSPATLVTHKQTQTDQSSDGGDACTTATKHKESELFPSTI